MQLITTIRSSSLACIVETANGASHMTSTASQARLRPLMIGVGGDSGSGKSTLVAGFRRLFGDDRITTICLDDYHSLDRKQRKAVGLTALNPRANNFAQMEEQLWALKEGRAIVKPVYDHHDGSFGDPDLLEPKRVVIVQGLHPFLTRGVRQLWDLKVWLDPQTDLKLSWKVRRDVARRGYSPEEVRAEIEARQPDVMQWIDPQRQHADLVVRFYRSGTEQDETHLNVRVETVLSLRRLNLKDVEELPLSEGGPVRHFVDTDGADPIDVLEIDGRVTPGQAAKLEERIWSHLDPRHQQLRYQAPSQIGSFYDPAAGRSAQRHSDPLALTQLLLVHRILSAQQTITVRVPVGALD
jgi:phosphoribulokinase